MGRGRRRVAKVIWLWVEERVWVRLRRLFLQEAIRVVLVGGERGVPAGEVSLLLSKSWYFFE